MIKVTAHRDNKKTVFTITDAPYRIRRGLRQALSDIGRENTVYARKIITSPPKTGRKYSGLPRRSSAPGEAPAHQFGGLKNSIVYKVHGYDSMEFGSTIEYSEYLENGTQKMQPRPWLSRTVGVKSGVSVRILRDRVDELLGKE